EPMSFEPSEPDLPQIPAPSFEMEEPSFDPPVPPVQLSMPLEEPAAAPRIPAEEEEFVPPAARPKPAEVPVRRSWEPPPIVTAPIVDLDPLNEPTISSGRSIASLTP